MISPRLPGNVEHWALDRLRPCVRNPRTHSNEQIAQIAGSILEFGFNVPCLVSRDGEVIAGHGRLEAARKLGLSTIPVLVLDHLSDAQRRAYLIADNAIALGSTWNDELLASELHALNGGGFDLSLLGFDEAELDRLLAPLDGGAGDERDADEGGADDEAAGEIPEPAKETVTRPGDLWLLGEHRLLCGDSTDAASVARVMAGERANLLFTSPPYGSQRDYTAGGIGDWEALMRGAFAHAGSALADDGQILVNLGLIHRDNEWQPYWDTWLDWMRGQGWHRFGLYVWDQGPGLPGDWNGRLAPSFEFLFHFNRIARKPNKIVPCKWAGHVNDSHGGMRARDGRVGAWSHAGEGVQETRIPDNVIRITRHKARGIETEHPAVFPAALPEFVMNAYSDPADLVFEPFAGSGTSLIAGERCGRKVRAIELAPEYVDLTIARWRKLFPNAPVLSSVEGLDGDGRSFDEIAAGRGIALERDPRVDHAA